MANHFGFQMSEDFLTSYADYVKLLREQNPGKTFVVKLSVDLVPDGIGYEITRPPQITVEEASGEEGVPEEQQWHPNTEEMQVIVAELQALDASMGKDPERWSIATIEHLWGPGLPRELYNITYENGLTVTGIRDEQGRLIRVDTWTYSATDHFAERHEEHE